MTETDSSTSARTYIASDLSTQRSILRLGAVVGFAVVSWITAGIAGLGIAAIVGILAFRVRPIITVGFAHAGIIVLLPELADISSLVSLAVFELCLFGMLASQESMSRPTIALTAGIAVVLGMSVVAVFIWTDLFVATMFLLCFVGVLGYGIHRYERVSLGLVADSTEKPQGDSQ